MTCFFMCYVKTLVKKWHSFGCFFSKKMRGGSHLIFISLFICVLSRHLLFFVHRPLRLLFLSIFQLYCVILLGISATFCVI